ncbi:MAG: hypothetical protein IJK89_13400 [Clostridia bacterium]|nr:hypothetical protein [Clostridia bacterium]
MKKTVFILLIAAVGTFLFAFRVGAAENAPEEDAWFAGLWDAVDANTRDLMEQLGIEGVDAQALLNVSPLDIFTLVGKLARGEATSPLRYAAASVLILTIASFAQTFLPEGGAMRPRCETVGHLCVMFALLAGAGQAVRESMSAVTATEDFILCLVPAFTGVIGMAGNPVLALSWGGAVLAFAETVGAFFAKFVPAAGALGAALCASANLNAETDLSGAAKLAAKAVTSAMGFVAGIFTAVLTIKDVIAGAADTVGMKGLKFVIGQSVPVVGSAVADALNSVAAGLTLLRDTAGAFAVLALFLIDLVPVLRLILWKLSFRLIAAAAGVFGAKRAAELTEGLNSLLSVILAAVCFNSAVFIIAVATVIRVKGG